MALLTVLLFDFLLLVVLGRLVYKSSHSILLSILNRIQSAADRGAQRRAQVHASSTAPRSIPGDTARPATQTSARLHRRGGIRGTVVEESDADRDAPEIPLTHRHLLSQRVQQRLLALERRPPPLARPDTSCHADWIAVSDPTTRLELPYSPKLIGVAHALCLELAATRPVRSMLGALAATVGYQGAVKPHSGVGPDIGAFRRLPQELVTEIILQSAAPSLSPEEPQSSPVSILLLSKQYHKLLLPKLYHTVSLHNAFAFRNFRLTLALHNPSLGKLVRRLQIGSAQFDSTGYIPGQLAEQGPLATGIEQMLLATPNLLELSIDLFSLVALHAGTASRLEKGCQPLRLSTELCVIPYLSLPTFEDLRDLELLVFGLDRQTAFELRVALPRLERLTLRFVTRRRSDRAKRIVSTQPGGAISIDHAALLDADNLDDEDDIFARSEDIDEFIESLELLRTWPGQDSSSGRRLSSLSVFTWPSALAALKARVPDARGTDEHSFDVEAEPGARCEDSDAKVDSKVDTDAPPAPLYAGIDTSYLLGPRRGAHVLWRKTRASMAWS
ncbi:uncharacterized protein PFL1_00356 [Pseudozyma flocculosa PF-1]|uniref:F-box domain-containing protein n=1 Tax=Pseudozyma flocculosa TaxID=84751 RepID=A0A5C3EV00_9BASI|nr:uncharacterized protein PFL1_00356 [Pseudozyma flocculosa PF-1]EPQ32159.1 hypothetical protein PFL1_00356 [Pseudozyma flocculosa PF-1]SPO34901.1 uncharacterized protein PSFLO_00372 [Pseudozyma flocculosa]